MPLPQPGQKGTKKKGGRDGRHNQINSSRNTTPIPFSTHPSTLESVESGIGTATATSTAANNSLLDLKIISYSQFRVDDLIDTKDNVNIPDIKPLDLLLNTLENLLEFVETKSHTVDRGMRKLVYLRKEKTEDNESERINTERRDAQMANRKKKLQAIDDAKSNAAETLTITDSTADTNTLSTSILPSNRKRALSHASNSSALSSPVGATSPTASAIPKTDPAEEDEEAEPTLMRGDVRFFGNDPSKYQDNVRYQVPLIEGDIKRAEGLEIAAVADMPWPVGRDTLLRYAPVEPPHDDFSAGKPTSQVQATTWLTSVEPYLRPLIEEDMALLRDRGSRDTPFLIPERNPKHYLQQWAEEDGEMDIDSESPQQGLSSVEPRGELLDLDENEGETDKVSLGPVQSRVLQLLRTEDRKPTAELSLPALGSNDAMLLDAVNGDMMPNDDLTASFAADMAMDQNFILDKDMDFTATNGTTNDLDGSMPFIPLDPINSNLGPINGGMFDVSKPLGSATAIVQPQLDASMKKLEPIPLSREQKDMRLLQEFLHTFGPTNALPVPAPGNLPGKSANFDAHNDDDIAVRLRYLQAELKEVAIKNAARKARVMDEAQAFYSKQEYDIVHDDLDAQVNDVHSKRTRTLKTGKNKKRSSTMGGATGQAKFVLGDRAKGILANRKKWEQMIGPALTRSGNYSVPRTGIPKEGEKAGEATSIFTEKIMESCLANERLWAETGADEANLEI